MCETLLRGVYKKIFFNPGLADSSRGKFFYQYVSSIKLNFCLMLFSGIIDVRNKGYMF